MSLPTWNWPSPKCAKDGVAVGAGPCVAVGPLGAAVCETPFCAVEVLPPELLNALRMPPHKAHTRQRDTRTPPTIAAMRAPGDQPDVRFWTWRQAPWA